MFPYDEPLDELEQAIVDECIRRKKSLGELMLERIEELKKDLEIK